MHKHGPDPLVGPLRGTTAWWHGRPAAEAPSAESPAEDDAHPPDRKPARVRKRGPRKIRTELVQRVKAEIAAGTYDTPERFQAALEMMMEKMWD